MLLTELGKEYGRSFEAAILDAEGIPEISAEYGISAVPTVVAFQVCGK
jgi:thioredoxin-like negative regulator of GroEL